MHVLNLQKTFDKVAIIGCGPSIKRLLPTHFIETDTIQINRPTIENPTFWMVLDKEIARAYSRQISYTHATMIFGKMSFAQCYKFYFVQEVFGKGFSQNLNMVFTGGSSVFASLQLAVNMGYSRIDVYGCDQAAEKGVFYASGEQPLVADREQRFDDEAKSFDWLTRNISPDNKKKIHFHSDLNNREWFINWCKYNSG